jgi:hypothetical protein
MKATVSLRRLPLIFLILALLVQGCHVFLISGYDEVTDKAATELQKKTTEFFIKLERNIGKTEASYESNKKFYDDFRVELSSLKVRADAVEKNKIVQDQIAELNKMIDSLEALHKIGFATAEQLKPLKQPFDSAFTAIIKFQLALKAKKKTK